MEIPDYYNLMRDWTVRIPRKLDGSGVVTLTMRAGSMKHFGLDKFPRPKDHGSMDPSGKFISAPLQIRFGGANMGSFRLAYDWAAGKQKPLACRFRLGSSYCIETIDVMTQFLRENYDGWFEFRNEANNTFYRRHFSSTVGLGGG